MVRDVAERIERGSIAWLLGDRSILEVGKRADINGIDYKGLSNFAPGMMYDLPTGVSRPLQRATSCKEKLLASEIVR